MVWKPRREETFIAVLVPIMPGKGVQTTLNDGTLIDAKKAQC